MKVLVTGGAGFVGSNVVKLLIDKGAEVFILDDFSHANFKNLEGVKAEVICGDILDEKIYDKLPELDGIIHEAAITDTLMSDDTRMMTVNYNGFKNVLEYSIKNNLRLVYASSAATYGDGPAPMVEDQKPQPLNTYAYSKYMCDVLFAKYKSKLSKGIIGLRYFNVYGPGEYHKGSASSMTYQLYRQMKEGKKPRVFNYGDQKRDFIYVKDVARITVAALESDKTAILNVGTACARSFNDIISALNAALGTNLKADYFDNPYSAVYQDFTEADGEKLEKVLGLKAKFSLEDGVADYVKGYLLK